MVAVYVAGKAGYPSDSSCRVSGAVVLNQKRRQGAYGLLSTDIRQRLPDWCLALGRCCGWQSGVRVLHSAGQAG
jgi:hypothetical protein